MGFEELARESGRDDAGELDTGSDPEVVDLLAYSGSGTGDLEIPYVGCPFA